MICNMSYREVLGKLDFAFVWMIKYFMWPKIPVMFYDILIFCWCSLLTLKTTVSNKDKYRIPTWCGSYLTPWDRVRHICFSKRTIISSDNGLSPGRRQTIIWTNAGKLLFGPPGTNFSEILIEIHTFSFKKMYLKMLSGKWQPFCLGLNVLTHKQLETHRCVLSTVDTDALVLKHQAISIHSPVKIYIVSEQFHTKI